jgi:hypothetical protein
MIPFIKIRVGAIFLFCLPFFLFAQEERPYWVDNIPKSNEYYRASGFTSTKGNNNNFQDDAIRNALKKISSQIVVDISGSSRRLIEEVMDVTAKDILKVTLFIQLELN